MGSVGYLSDVVLDATAIQDNVAVQEGTLHQQDKCGLFVTEKIDEDDL